MDSSAASESAGSALLEENVGAVIERRRSEFTGALSTPNPLDFRLSDPAPGPRAVPVTH